MQRNLFSNPYSNGGTHASRTKTGRFKKSHRPSVLHDHNYEINHVCDSVHGCDVCCPGITNLLNSRKISMVTFTFMYSMGIAYF